MKTQNISTIRNGKMTRKQIKDNRLWKHWLHWLNVDEGCYGNDLKKIENYDPNVFRDAFSRFQTHGKKNLTDAEMCGIAPLIAAQKAKEIFLTSLVQESFEWWASCKGSMYPWMHTFDMDKTDTKKLDRLTKLAMLRIMKGIKDDPIKFFDSHTGISKENKCRLFDMYASTLQTFINNIHNKPVNGSDEKHVWKFSVKS